MTAEWTAMWNLSDEFGLESWAARVKRPCFANEEAVAEQNRVPLVTRTLKAATYMAEFRSIHDLLPLRAARRLGYENSVTAVRL